MDSSVLTEFLDAAFLSTFVEHKHEQHGGVMLVGPPGVMKSSLIEAALSPYPQALVLSDINIVTLSKMRDDLVSGRYKVIAFEEFQKLYERKGDTAKNIEGAIKALTDQGFLHPSFTDQRMAAMKARMLVIGAMTLSFYANKFSEWRDSGFARRFIWITYRTSDYQVIGDAIEQGRRIKLDGIARRWPRDRSIPCNIGTQDAKWLRGLLRDQTDDLTSQILLQKIFAALTWKYDAKKARNILHELEPCLGKYGGEMTLTLEDKNDERRKEAHNGKDAGRKLRGGTVRRRTAGTSKATKTKVRVNGLEGKRELSVVPTESVPLTGRSKNEEVNHE